MKKIINLIGYICTMLLFAYLTLSSGLIIYLQGLGMKLIIFHPSLPFTADYISEFNIIPQMVQFVTLGVCWIYFGKKGFKLLKRKRTD